MPSKRIMVIATAGEYCIDFRTVSWWKKSPRRFVIVRERLENLRDEQTEIVSDIHCFAALRRSQATGLLTIDFTWLSGGFGGEVKGWEESVSIPFEPLLTFMRESADEGGPEVWKHLSVCQKSRPRLVFRAQERLRECVTNRVVRKNYPTHCGTISAIPAWSGSSSTTTLRHTRSSSRKCGGMVVPALREVLSSITMTVI